MNTALRKSCLFTALFSLLAAKGCSRPMGFGGDGTTPSARTEQTTETEKPAPIEDFGNAQPPVQVAGVSLTFSCEEVTQEDKENLHFKCTFLDPRNKPFTGNVDLHSVAVRHGETIRNVTFESYSNLEGHWARVTVPAAWIVIGSALEAAYSLPVVPSSPDQPEPLPPVVQSAHYAFSTQTLSRAEALVPKATPTPTPTPAMAPPTCETATLTKREIVVDFAANTQTCDWGVNGNQERTAGEFSARREVLKSVALNPGETVCRFTVRASGTAVQAQDVLLLALSGRVLFSTQHPKMFPNAPFSEGFYSYSWSNYVGAEWNSSTEYCLAGSTVCELPVDDQGIKDLNFEAPAAITAPLVGRVMTAGKFALKAVVIGDNNDEDCTHSAFSVKVEVESF